MNSADRVPPHCDASVLHAPGSCHFCDDYPDWQKIRVTQRINFTGEHDPDKAPCPSTWFRPEAVRDLWYGNRPAPVGVATLPTVHRCQCQASSLFFSKFRRTEMCWACGHWKHPKDECGVIMHAADMDQQIA